MGYHHGNLREALLEATEALIAELGPDGFSMRQVAKRVGVSHTAAYRHFADRDALLASVAERGFQELNAAFAALEGPAEVRFADAGVAYVRYAVDHPSRYKVMFRMRAVSEVHGGLRDAGDRAFHHLLSLVREGQRGGWIREAPEEMIALTAWSLVHGLATLLIDGSLPPDVPVDVQVAPALTALLMGGLGVVPGE